MHNLYNFRSLSFNYNCYNNNCTKICTDTFFIHIQRNNYPRKVFSTLKNFITKQSLFKLHGNLSFFLKFIEALRFQEKSPFRNSEGLQNS